MATPTKGGTEANAPVRRDSLGEKIAIAEMKIEYLRALGVDTSRLDKLLARAKKALASRSYTDAEGALDEMLIFFSVVSEEVGGLIDRFLGPGKSKMPTPRSQGPKSGPTLDEVRETVEDAFLKALHSQNLRR
ncbi:MAG: hypothetical protein ACYTFG_10420, partial [Planctomycetota bacterium]